MGCVVHEVAKELDTTEQLNNSILRARASWRQQRDSWRNFTPCSGEKESRRTPASQCGRLQCVLLRIPTDPGPDLSLQ